MPSWCTVFLCNLHSLTNSCLFECSAVQDEWWSFKSAIIHWFIKLSVRLLSQEKGTTHGMRTGGGGGYHGVLANTHPSVKQISWHLSFYHWLELARYRWAVVFIHLLICTLPIVGGDRCCKNLTFSILCFTYKILSFVNSCHLTRSNKVCS